MTLSALTSELASRVPLMPQSGGVFGWVAETAAELQVTLTILVGALTAVAAVIVFIKSSFSIGKTIMVAIVGGLLTFFVGGGMGWLSGLLGATIQG